MRRRDVLAGSTLLMAMLSRRTDAQPVRRSLRLGYLALFATDHLIEAFERGMRDLGYVTGRNLTIEYRFSEGRQERMPALASELVGLNPDALVTVGNAATIAAQRITSTLPLIAAPAGDPVGTGLVPSLARPGGNLTGVSIMAVELADKRLELIRSLQPQIRTVTVLGNATNPSAVRGRDLVVAAGTALGLAVRPALVNGVHDLGTAFDTIVRDHHPDALLVLTDAGYDAVRHEIVRLAAEHRLPAIYEHRAFTVAGGLMSYGADIDRMSYRAASYVHKILNGAKPSELPIEQPTAIQFIINLKTARALGLTVPRELLVRADEIIE